MHKTAADVGILRDSSIQVFHLYSSLYICNPSVLAIVRLWTCGNSCRAISILSVGSQTLHMELRVNAL